MVTDHGRRNIAQSFPTRVRAPSVVSGLGWNLAPPIHSFNKYLLSTLLWSEPLLSIGVGVFNYESDRVTDLQVTSENKNRKTRLAEQ